MPARVAAGVPALVDVLGVPLSGRPAAGTCGQRRQVMPWSYQSR
ncbi:hypothetical protein [Streptomyces spectabilis]|uniref:Uncharacterized protein n=1 Tax=Streptomyces spectabilis TaxID=68270 RepID=A0A7W8EY05_STRST|nr:hypothetical protein [Streptomyces spectabilis]MBB5107878.1 hypothetical protein [Streptomyces spectabilis]